MLSDVVDSLGMCSTDEREHVLPDVGSKPSRLSTMLASRTTSGAGGAIPCWQPVAASPMDEEEVRPIFIELLMSEALIIRKFRKIKFMTSLQFSAFTSR